METRPRSWKKFFTIEQANATLPLVSAIVRDIADLVVQLRQQDETLDTEAASVEYDHAKARMRELEQELRGLGVELKDYSLGLVDFPHYLDGREVCLCWRLGDERLAYWHELDDGYAGRQPLPDCGPA